MDEKNDTTTEAGRAKAQTPEDWAGVKLGPASKAAGGWTAVRKAAEPTLQEMGAKRGIKAWLTMNQKEGFDCPSCAWPDPKDSRHRFEFCENGAKAVADEATTRKVTPEFFAQWSVPALGEKSDQWLGKQGRITHPMVRRPGRDHYEPLEWKEAFALIAGELNALGSPDEAVFYTSGRTSNEAAFLYQLFVRQFGTNNLPDCSNMCHESSGRAMNETIGVGKSTVSLEDLESADLILVVGQNPGTNHPRMLSSLQAAARKGAAIVSINPLPETGTAKFKHPQELHKVFDKGTALATVHLPVTINGDVALFKGIMKAMLEMEDVQPGTVLDQAFIAQHTAEFETFAEDLRRTAWREIVEGSGLDERRIRETAELAAK